MSFVPAAASRIASIGIDANDAPDLRFRRNSGIAIWGFVAALAAIFFAERTPHRWFAGLPDPRPDHTEAVAGMALEMLDAARMLEPHGLAVRIGMDVGPVTAGVIGRRKFAYDLWGDAVNCASRMESQGVPGRIKVSPAVERRLRERFAFEPRGPVEVIGKGRIEPFFLVGSLEGRGVAVSLIRPASPKPRHARCSRS